MKKIIIILLTGLILGLMACSKGEAKQGVFCFWDDV